MFLKKNQEFNDTSKSGQSRKGKRIRKGNGKGKGKNKGKSPELQRAEKEKTGSSTDIAELQKFLMAM